MRWSWWRYFWLERSAPVRFRRIERGPEWPDDWSPDTIYVQGEDGVDWAAAFVCPCGCRDIVYLNLVPDRRPRWRIWESWHGLPGITPSVWRQVKCRSHFIVSNGRVIMCRWEEWGDE